MIGVFVRRVMPNRVKSVIKKIIQMFFHTKAFTHVHNYRNLRRNASHSERYLEIGPGGKPLDGFETLNVSFNSSPTYVLDASKNLPFEDDTFDIVYASHVLEHIPWYQTVDVLVEWTRVLKRGGTLEIWVPNQLTIAKVLVDYEETGVDTTDEWSRFGADSDPVMWFSGRTYTYGDGLGEKYHPNWHRACFTPRYLKKLMEVVGLVNVQQMTNSEVRGYDHGWINLGVKGQKPESH